MSPPVVYLILAASIVVEVIGTAALHASQQFTRAGPGAIAVLCYGLAILGVSVALRHIPMGIVYAVWSGSGIVLIALIGRALFDQRLDGAALIGIGLICTGVVVLYGFSRDMPK